MQPDNKPPINNLNQVEPASFKSFSSCPDTLKFGDFTIVRFYVFDYFKFSSAQSSMNIFCNHWHFLLLNYIFFEKLLLGTRQIIAPVKPYPK